MNQSESGRYSISPNSGRLRKRIKKKNTSSESGIFKKRLDNFSFNSKLSFLFVSALIIVALYIAYARFQSNKQEALQKYGDNPLREYYNKYYNKKR
jgi:hypothetical protein